MNITVLRILGHSFVYFIIIAISSQISSIYSKDNIFEQYSNNNGSYVATLNSYSMHIFVCLSLLGIGIYLICISETDTKNTQLMVTMFVFMILTFGYSFYFLKNIQKDMHELKQEFMQGQYKQISSKKSQQIQWQWIGYDFLKREYYYQEVYLRVERFINKDQQVIQALYDAQQGITNLRNWVLNHIFFIDMIQLIFKHLGIIAFLVITKVIVSAACMIGLKRKFFYILFYLACWGIGTVFYIFKMIAHSLSLLNQHQLCLNRSNSGQINIVINRQSIQKLSQTLNPIMDYYKVYSNICSTLEVFYSETNNIHKSMESNVFCFITFGCILAALYFIWAVKFKSRQQLNSYYTQIDQI